jgi:glutathione reductase (NADPH)
VVVGAGYIAVELATILAELGSKTNLLIRHDRVLRTFDETMSEAMTKLAGRANLNLMKNTIVIDILFYKLIIC